MSIDYLEKLPKGSVRLVKQIGALADARNVSVFLVGGTVRDLILKRQHFDMDFVVEGDAIAFAREVGRILKAEQVITHKSFGTAALVLKNGLVLDFASCRAESYAAPGKLPQVHKGTIQEDLFRRDFTINAMGLRINRSRWSELIDPFGGLKDLKAKRIRILHDQSFTDDSTRILRAIRFEQRFGFRMTPKTLKLLKERLASRVSVDYAGAAPGRAIDHVSVQRFFNEFKKMLNEDRVIDALKRCGQVKAERVLHPQFKLDVSTLSVVQGRFPVILKKKYGLMGGDRWKIFMMAFLERQAAGVRSECLAKLSLNATDRKSFEGVVAAIDFSAKLCQNALSPSEVYQLLKPLTRELCLYLCCRTVNVMALKRLDRFLKNDCDVSLEIDGNVVKSLGVTGARIRQVLEKTLYHKVDTGFRSKQDELNFVKNLISVEGP